MVGDILSAVRRLAAAGRLDGPTRRAGAALAVVTAVAIMGGVAAAALVKMGATSEVLAMLAIGREGGVVEQIAWACSGAAAALLLAAWRRRGAALLLALSAFYAFATLDNALRYHQRLGVWLVETFDVGALPGLPPQDSGELIAWALAAVALAPLAVWAGRRAGPGDGALLRVFLPWLAVLAVCGVGLDLLAVAIPGKLGVLIGWAEPAGELLALAGAAVTALALLRTDFPHEARAA